MLRVALDADVAQFCEAMWLPQLLLVESLLVLDVRRLAIITHDAELVANHVLETPEGSVINAEASEVISTKTKQLLPNILLVSHYY